MQRSLEDEQAVTRQAPLRTPTMSVNGQDTAHDPARRMHHHDHHKYARFDLEMPDEELHTTSQKIQISPDSKRSILGQIDNRGLPAATSFLDIPREAA
ncbi:hypothetical protein BS47DRAFT_346205 [Hydnum rufescens UP504]|uniref:Uncharacterized protein n=1 Tax=Hydnum rufescens UP504 TaxID=1448309 RepID=A0A9P6AJW9_9AGAM|nr:hypothetical protein BS47DRAFT_346205 [Hydnum rufescens UP504]